MPTVRTMIHFFTFTSVICVLLLVIFTLRLPGNILRYMPRGFRSTGCIIPRFDAFDKSIAKLVHLHEKLKCDWNCPITYQEDNMIHINWTVVNTSCRDQLKYCKYQSISRGQKQVDSDIVLGNFSMIFNQSIQINNEFVTVSCFNNSEEVFYRNFHAFVTPSKERNQICDEKLEHHQKMNKPKEILNVLMVGIDSLSRLNSVRQLPLMRKFIFEKLGGIEMLGYTKVADNTFVNVVPILTGKFVEELPWNETMKNEPFDKYNFIWTNFSQNGYITLYAEDAPGMTAFNYLKKGFNQQPTDHYIRPFSLAMEREVSVWNTDHHCLGDRLETEIVLNYLRDFSKTYQTKPHFGFVFISRLTHGGANSAGAADDPHHSFLQGLHNANLLNNTVLIYFSDHGMRYGDIRNTYIGKVEDRMPLLAFVFPLWFKSKYPSLIENIEINSNRLSSPFDLHKTLKDILNFNGVAKSPNMGDRSISFFSEIPRDRSCDDAGILPHWCMCLEKEQIPISSPLIKEAANTVIHHINDKLSPFNHSCAVLTLKEIQAATQMLANQKVLTFQRSVNDVINRTVHYGSRENASVLYQVTLVASPGGGIFEATVSFDETTKSYSLAGDISRINLYGNQSGCISDFKLKRYCFCKFL